MPSFQNYTMEGLKMLSKARSMDSYESLSMQQLENTFTTPFVPNPTPKPAPKPTSEPKKCTPTTVTRLKKHTSAPILKLRKSVPTLINR